MTLSPPRRLLLKASQVTLFGRAPIPTAASAPPSPSPVANKGPQQTTVGRVTPRVAPNPGASAPPSPAHSVLVPGVRTLAPNDVILQEEIAPLRSSRGLAKVDPGNPNKKTVYRLRRYFFATKKGETPLAPVELVERVVSNYYAKRNVQGHEGPARWWPGEPEVWQPVTFARRGSDGHGGYTREEVTEWAWSKGSPKETAHTAGGRARQVYGTALEGHYVEHVPCNEKCTGASRPKCECSCGGANHGRGNQMRWKPHTAGEVRRLLNELQSRAE